MSRAHQPLKLLEGISAMVALYNIHNQDSQWKGILPRLLLAHHKISCHGNARQMDRWVDRQVDG